MAKENRVGGPNCRSQSVLRHYPGGPRPVRWGGESISTTSSLAGLGRRGGHPHVETPVPGEGRTVGMCFGPRAGG